ncbi:nuclear transport factor 2 family protein [Bordetella petrii]|uniref:nuclear transport factor 2 family protein n=1 Tax=Bordetella petrii TaxID=94624 RepID=UPI001E296067|nr:nuclear transport factor 2 family protein [Bordetella petrii]MCD0506283.1 nuclear transport factor 2 family protein [Bordetella petrii]
MERDHDAQAAKAACEAVILAFFHALDTRRHEEVAALMAEDGIWHRQGKALRGPGDVLQALQARPAGRSTCHIITNVRLLQSDGRQASLGYFLTAYESVARDDGPGEVRLVAIRDCRDTLVRTPQGWRLSNKQSHRHLPPE